MYRAPNIEGYYAIYIVVILYRIDNGLLNKYRFVINMHEYTLDDVFNTIDRYKLFVLPCEFNQFEGTNLKLITEKIPVLNIGRELAEYINKLDDLKYVNMDSQRFINDSINRQSVTKNNTLNKAIAIYNIGILLEPTMQLNATTLLKDLSKTHSLIIIWEHLIEVSDRLNWPINKKYCLDFSDIHLKKIHI